MSSLARRFVTWRRVATNLLFPPRCIVCDEDLGESPTDILLCPSCRYATAPELWVGCPRCGGALATQRHDAPWCGQCRDAKLEFDGVRPLGEYAGTLRDACLQMKRDTSGHVTMNFARLYWRLRGAAVGAFGCDAVLAVPMHWRRRLLRGVNSPELFGRILAERLRTPLLSGVLSRRKPTALSRELTPKQRIANVRGAFRVKRPEEVADRHILLVDDILTTGATCNEVARVLKEAGARRVSVAVLARAEAPGRPAVRR